MNERVMMFGAIVLAIIAIVLGGYSFGEVRSLSNMVETQQAQIDALEAAEPEAPENGIEQLQGQVEQLAAEVAELSERLDRIAGAFDAVNDAEPVDEPQPEEDLEEAPEEDVEEEPEQ